MKRVFPYFVVGFTTLTAPVFAQVTLSGASMWAANSAAGDAAFSSYWDTVGAGNSTGIANVYLFTGSIGSPTFLNSGDTNTSLNPNLSLTAGTYVIYFAGYTPLGSYAGINLFFDGDLVDNRISAVVHYDGSNNFSVISGATTTSGENGVHIAGSGSLSYTAEGLLVTVTGMGGGPSSPDLVSYFSTLPSGGGSTVASMTLTVTAVPEPASFATLCGVAVMTTALFRRKKCAGRFDHSAASAGANSRDGRKMR